MTKHKDPFYQFSRVRPLALIDLVRLSIGFMAALMFKISGLKRAYPALGELSPGIFVPDRDRPVRAKCGQGIITARPRELGLFTGLYEPVTISWFKPTSGETVVDVGAHIGSYTSIAAVRGARVIAVEPDRSNFDLLVRNVYDNGFGDRVSTWQVALSDRDGRREFYVSPSGNSFLSSLDPRWILKDPRGKVVSTLVECMTLDALVERCGVKRVHWLKIDVEGHTAQVLRGGVRTLGITENLIVEVPEYDRAVYDACLRSITDAGLKIKAVERFGGAGEGVGNWLCVREQLSIGKTVN